MKAKQDVLRHPLTHIHPDAQISEDVEIGPFVTIEGDVVIGPGCKIGPNAVIHDGARIGSNVQIFPSAVISGIPQDLKFKGEVTTAEIGDNSVIREFVTVNRGTTYSHKTVVGKNVLLMAYAHIAHDCIVKDHAIVANAVQLAGHVTIEEFAIIGGSSAIHQFCTIGRHSILAGGSLVGKDIPPYIKAARYPISYAGVNSLGMRRRGFSNETIAEVKEIYRAIFLSGMNHTKAIAFIEATFPPTAERDEILSFLRHSRIGILRGYTGTSSGDDE